MGLWLLWIVGSRAWKGRKVLPKAAGGSNQAVQERGKRNCTVPAEGRGLGRRGHGDDHEEDECDEDRDGHDDESLSGGAKAGLIVGTVVAIAAGVTSLVLWVRKRRRVAAQGRQPGQPAMELNSLSPEHCQTLDPQSFPAYYPVVVPVVELPGGTCLLDPGPGDPAFAGA